MSNKNRFRSKRSHVKGKENKMMTNRHGIRDLNSRGPKDPAQFQVHPGVLAEVMKALNASENRKSGVVRSILKATGLEMVAESDLAKVMGAINEVREYAEKNGIIGVEDVKFTSEQLTEKFFSNSRPQKWDIVTYANTGYVKSP